VTVLASRPVDLLRPRWMLVLVLLVLVVAAELLLSLLLHHHLIGHSREVLTRYSRLPLLLRPVGQQGSACIQWRGRRATHIAVRDGAIAAAARQCGWGITDGSLAQ
jgi:hypothetical protein